MNPRGHLRALPAVLVLGIGCLIGASLAILGCSTSPGELAARSSSSAPRVLATLPDFAIEDERGVSIGLHDLRGTVWVANFFFTRCTGTCPLITPRMAELGTEFASSPALRDVKLVSFSVDPDFDRPDVLR